MRRPTLAVALMAAAVCIGAPAEDMLPLKQGIYVPTNRPCKGASNAEIVNYWGGKSSFGSAQAICTISKMTRNGNVFTITDKCADIKGGGEIVGGPTVVAIANQSSFTMADQTYRHCGTRVQFRVTDTLGSLYARYSAESRPAATVRIREGWSVERQPVWTPAEVRRLRT